jgi:hypothetical protein
MSALREFDGRTQLLSPKLLAWELPSGSDNKFLIQITTYLKFQTCSPDLAHNMSSAVATELRAFYNAATKAKIYGRRGVNCFTPVINIMRHPLWGRNQVKD